MHKVTEMTEHDLPGEQKNTGTKEENSNLCIDTIIYTSLKFQKYLQLSPEERVVHKDLNHGAVAQWHTPLILTMRQNCR